MRRNSYDIALRQGGIKMYIGKSVTVKPGKKVRVSIVNADGDGVSLENFNGYETNNAQVDNLVYVDDVLYQLSSAKVECISAYMKIQHGASRLRKVQK